MSRPICPLCHEQGWHQDDCIQPTLSRVEELEQRIVALETIIFADTSAEEEEIAAFDFPEHSAPTCEGRDKCLSVFCFCDCHFRNRN